MKVSEYLMTELEYNKLYQQEKELHEKRLKYEELSAEISSLEKLLSFLSEDHDLCGVNLRIDNYQSLYSFNYINYDDIKDILIKKTREQLTSAVNKLSRL